MSCEKFLGQIPVLKKALFLVWIGEVWNVLEATVALWAALIAGSVALLGFGLLLNGVLGWWWADPLMALALVPFLVKEGLESFEDK